MSFADIVVIAVLFAAVTAAVFIIVRNKQKGKNCRGGCSGCSGCDKKK